MTGRSESQMLPVRDQRNNTTLVMHSIADVPLAIIITTLTTNEVAGSPVSLASVQVTAFVENNLSNRIWTFSPEAG